MNTMHTEIAETHRNIVGLRLRAVCLVWDWPSLGITRKRPLWGLRDGRGQCAARSQDAHALLAWAVRNHHTVVGAFA